MARRLTAHDAMLSPWCTCSGLIACGNERVLDGLGVRFGLLWIGVKRLDHGPGAAWRKASGNEALCVAQAE